MFELLEKKLRGRFARDVDLGRRSWFRTGGRADYFFEPVDRDDLVFFLKNCPSEVPIEVIGAGSNLLVRDGGVRGVVISPCFDEVRCEGNFIEAGVSVLARRVADTALARRLSGFEFMRGIPGSVGGCLAMNAGAYGCETSDIFIKASAVDRDGREYALERKDMDFGYRRARAGYIFVSAIFEGVSGEREAIRDKMDWIIAERKAAQPSGGRTGGSTFKNPLPHISAKKAWQLIDESGCRDFSRGDARLCEEHCNFLINRGRASAEEIEVLGERVRARVEERTGIVLEWEVKRIGDRL